MKFHIGHISKMTGMSPTAIRYYEQIGLISPLRGENQKYRDFDLQDFFLLATYKWYRNLGYTVEEADKLINKVTPEQFQVKLEEKEKTILQEIEYKKLLAKHINNFIESLKLLQEGKQLCRIKRNPALLRIKIWQPGLKERDCLSFAQAVEWFEKTPFTNPCLLISSENILHGNGVLSTDWGMSVEEKTAEVLEFQKNPIMERIPSQLCVHTFVEPCENLSINSDQLVNIRKYIQDNHYTITSSAIGWCNILSVKC